MALMINGNVVTSAEFAEHVASVSAKYDAEEARIRRERVDIPQPVIDRSKAPCDANGGITVAELITQLTACPRDARVICEGCDCYQRAWKVEIDDGVVVIQTI